MNLLDALETIFAPAFPDRSPWAAWRAFLAATFALPMSEAERETYTQHTGRSEVPPSPAREAWVVVGRRGGKSRMAALIATWLATRDYSGIFAPGEVGTLPIVAADRRQARTVMGYVKALVQGSPVLVRLVEHETADSLMLATRVRLEVHTASWRAFRGYTVVGAVLDEVAFWRSDESANPDREIVNALRPAMATVPGHCSWPSRARTLAAGSCGRRIAGTTARTGTCSCGRRRPRR